MKGRFVQKKPFDSDWPYASLEGNSSRHYTAQRMQKQLHIAPDSFFVRWAYRLRSLSTPTNTPSRQTILRLWFYRPSREIAALAGIFLLTVVVAAVRPRLLYVAKAATSSDPDDNTSLFLDYRALVLLLFAVMEIGLGETVIPEEDLQFGVPVLNFMARYTLTPVVVLVYLLLSSLTIWVGSRVANAPLTVSQSVRATGYGMAGALFGPFFILVAIAPLVVTGVLLTEILPAMGLPLAIAGVAFGVTIVGYYVIHITFIVPISVLYPATTKPKLWFGWFVGFTLPVLVLVAVLLLVGGLVLVMAATTDAL